MHLQLVACVAFCASLVATRPQNYVAPTNHHFVVPTNQQRYVAPRNQQSYVAQTSQQNYVEPTNYQALGVLEPQSRDLGAQEKIVAATIDLLPEISELFERVTLDRSNDPERIQEIFVDFMPITRKVMYATADVEGRSIPIEDVHRFNAAEAVLPSVITFMNRLRDMDFFGVQNNDVSYQ